MSREGHISLRAVIRVAECLRVCGPRCVARSGLIEGYYRLGCHVHGSRWARFGGLNRTVLGLRRSQRSNDHLMLRPLGGDDWQYIEITGGRGVDRARGADRENALYLAPASCSAPSPSLLFIRSSVSYSTNTLLPNRLWARATPRTKRNQRTGTPVHYRPPEASTSISPRLVLSSMPGPLRNTYQKAEAKYNVTTDCALHRLS